MTIISDETWRLAMLGDICSEWEVTHEVFNKKGSISESSIWGSLLINLSKHPNYTTEFREFVVLLLWCYYNEKSI